MKIVCGTDFSQAARSAVDAAAAIAARTRGDLRIVHVLEDQKDEAARKELAAAAERELGREVARARERSGILADAQILTGSAWEQLIDFTSKRKCDLLIVASRGHGTSPLYKSGSTSERIAQSAHVPTLIVRDSEPFETWARGTRPLKILLCIDESAAAAWAFQFVGRLREIESCDVVIGHVYRADEVRRRYGLSPRLSLVDPEPEAERMLARDFKRTFGELPGRGNVEIRPEIGIGRAGDILVELAATENADLVVVGTHHQRGLARLGATAAVVAHYSDRAVAIVPGTAEAMAPEAPIERYRKVLIATELTPDSIHAIAYGYALLGRGHGEVVLAHVCAPKTSAEQREEIAARLRALIPHAAADRGVLTQIDVSASANVASTIVAVAERAGVDALCVASRPQEGLRGLILGSVAARILAESLRPVLVVRPPKA